MRVIQITKTKILTVGLILILCLTFSGCTQNLSNEEQRFVGTWTIEGMNSTVTFYNDGHVSEFLGDTFEVRDGKLIILTIFAGGDVEDTYDYIFSDNSTTLLLININTGEEINLLK